MALPPGLLEAAASGDPIAAGAAMDAAEEAGENRLWMLFRIQDRAKYWCCPRCEAPLGGAQWNAHRLSCLAAGGDESPTFCCREGCGWCGLAAEMLSPLADS